MSPQLQPCLQAAHLLALIALLLAVLLNSEADALPSLASSAAAAFIYLNPAPHFPATSCRDLSESASPWLLELCLSSGADAVAVTQEPAWKCRRCSGHFVLRLGSGSACGASERGLPLSPDAETDALVRGELGPHELLAFIEGPERAWLRPEHQGSCSYKLPFHVQVPGKYQLHILQVRSNFAAMDETIDAFPPIDAVYITGLEGLRFSLGESIHGTDYDKQVTAKALHAVLSRSDLPRCSSGNAAGRFVFAGALSSLYEAIPRAAHILASARFIDRTNYTTHVKRS